MERYTPSPTNDEAEPDEIEVSAFDGAGSSRSPYPLPGPQTPPMRSPRARLLSAGAATLLVFLLVTLGIPPIRSTLGQQIASRLGPAPILRTPSPPRTPSIFLPSLPAPILAPAPTTCPSLPALTHAAVPFFGQAIGRPPVYISGLSASERPTYLRVTPTNYTAYGWQASLLWAIEPGYTQQIALHGQRLTDGQPISLSVGYYQAPAAKATLDPLVTSDISEGAHWSNWFGMLFLPSAGCYTLQAEWPGGSWSIPFAVGR